MSVASNRIGFHLTRAPGQLLHSRAQRWPRSHPPPSPSSPRAASRPAGSMFIFDPGLPLYFLCVEVLDTQCSPLCYIAYSTQHSTRCAVCTWESRLLTQPRARGATQVCGRPCDNHMWRPCPTCSPHAGPCRWVTQGHAPFHWPRRCG